MCREATSPLGDLSNRRALEKNFHYQVFGIKLNLFEEVYVCRIYQLVSNEEEDTCVI